jgi:integrase
MPRATLGIREVEALQPGQTVWDGRVTGFGARRQRDAVSYFLMYRTNGRLRRVTIGRHRAPWLLETARREALRLLGEVAIGNDPAAEKREARRAETVAELCDRYMEAATTGRLWTRRGRPKKASTLTVDRSRIEAHVKPLLGTRTVRSITRRDIEAFMHRVAEGATARTARSGRPRGLARVSGGWGAASRTIGMLGAIFEYAVRIGLRPDNPVRGVQRPADGKRDRRLTEDEYARLGATLRRLEADRAMWPHALAAARFLALTGWRFGEAVTLRWRDLDTARRTARLGDTKTGASVRALSRLACDVIEVQRERTGGGADDLVFPASRGTRGTAMVGMKSFMRRISAEAGLTGVTAHTLRHSFASVAADLGISELVIAGLLGHRLGSVTARYAHAADTTLIAAADRVAAEVARQMGEAPGATVTVLPVARAVS